HNTEKVVYFLLLDRKRRKPAYEDEAESIIRNRSESGKELNTFMLRNEQFFFTSVAFSTSLPCSVPADPPRKRVDTCHLNGRSGPRYSFDMLSDGSPLTPRRYPYGRSRRSSMSSSLHVTSPAVSPLSSPKPTPRGTPEESPLNTPPGSPGMNQPYWKSRLNTIKSSFLGSPRFHRRKMQ
ncbi:hypothetical protein NPIL_565171, partial [Nephila pilipes]